MLKHIEVQNVSYQLDVYITQVAKYFMKKKKRECTIGSSVETR